jgi:hypothetical protein
LQYTHARVDDVEALTLGATELRVDGGQSSTGRLGLMLSKRFAQGGDGWEWTPYAVLSGVREFDGDEPLLDQRRLFRIDHPARHQRTAGSRNQRPHRPFTLSGGLNWQDGGVLERVLGRPGEPELPLVTEKWGRSRLSLHGKSRL